MLLEVLQASKLRDRLAFLPLLLSACSDLGLCKPVVLQLLPFSIYILLPPCTVVDSRASCVW